MFQLFKHDFKIKVSEFKGIYINKYSDENSFRHKDFLSSDNASLKLT